MNWAQSINNALRTLPAWLLYPIGFLPAAWLWYLGLTGGLGAEPIREMELQLGRLALKLIVLGLAITPLRRFTGVNLLRYRRAIGLLAFYYVLMHLSVWLILDIGDPARIWADIVKRPYVTIGMAGLLTLLPLALTSTDRAVRWLGPVRWRLLHRLVYVAALLGVLHFAWLVKGLPLRPMVYALIIAALLLLRLWPKRRRALA